MQLNVEDRETTMGRIFPMTTAAMAFTTATAFAQMGGDQDGHMTGTGNAWGMGYGWVWGPIVVIVVVLGAVYLLKKK